jgi:hypothetical protein
MPKLGVLGTETAPSQTPRVLAWLPLPSSAQTHLFLWVPGRHRTEIPGFWEFLEFWLKLCILFPSVCHSAWSG